MIAFSAAALLALPSGALAAPADDYFAIVTLNFGIVRLVINQRSG
jgi:hypothetical protein